MVQKVWEKTAENLDFIEYSNFIWETTEAAFRRCSDIKFHYGKIAGIRPVTLLQFLRQVFSYETAFLQHVSGRLEILWEYFEK